MADKMHAKVYLSVKTDLNALWLEISKCKGVHLSGYDSDYLVLYDGKKEPGLEVLRLCMDYSSVGRIFIEFGE